MTCHVSLIGDSGAVVLADSQGSGFDDKMHGLQKLFPGTDYVVGFTGSVEIGYAIFEALAECSAGLDSKSVSGFLTNLLDDILRPEARQEIELLVTTQDGLSTYRPGTFRKPRNRGRFATVGSGAQFVGRAYQRDQRLGIVSPTSSLGDTFCTAEALLDAADESLTVDNRLLLGIAAEQKIYVSGDAAIELTFAPDSLAPILAAWDLNTKRFSAIRALAVQIRSELQESLRRYSSVRNGNLGPSELAAIQTASTSISTLRRQLDTMIAEFRAWYDLQLGR